MVLPKDPENVAPDFEHKLVLFAASGVEDEEEIAEAFYLCGLKEDEGMKVLGGGSLEIDADGERIIVSTTSPTFGQSDSSIVSKILEESWDGYSISFV